MRKRIRVLVAALLWSTALVPAAHADPVTAVIGVVGSLFTGAASFLGGAGLLAGVARLGLGLAANVLLDKWGRQKQKSQASQLETAYGEDGPRQVILGTIGTAGQHVYRNSFSKGNRRIQDVYRLADFRITRIRRIMYDGKWVNAAGAQNAEAGFRIPGIGKGPGGAELWIKTYHGTMEQQADPGLIARANPPTRWTANHRGAGIAYVIATYQIEKEDITQPWQAFFEVDGAPLYDWRLDSTVGGTGNCRWDDQSTWVFTKNPVVQMYNLERGLYNGTELIVGKGTPSTRLNSKISEWTVAANICDEIMPDGSRRYESSLIAVAGDGAAHEANMRPLREACAASWVEDAEGQYPIVGANQAVAFVFTDEDICWEESFRFSFKRKHVELVNTTSGKYVDPDKFYQTSPLATRIDKDAIAQDRERLAAPLSFTAVTDVRVADRLADIAFRASRYQANGAIVLRPKFLDTARIGRWGRWDSKKYNQSFTLQILTRQLGPLGPKGARNVHLTLQEVGNGIFDPTQFTTVPVVTVPIGDPDYLNEVQNLVLSPLVVAGSNGSRMPAIRTQRDPITDITVRAVEFRYYPKDQPEAVNSKTVAVDVEVTPLIEGIVSSTEYAVETRLQTQPYRTTAWSAPKYIVTPNQPLTDIYADLQRVAEDVKVILRGLEQQAREVDERFEQIAAATAVGTGQNVIAQQVAVKTQNAFAAALLEMSATVEEVDGQMTAIGEAMLGVQAMVDNVSAGGLISFKAQVPPPAGVLSQISVMARATVDGEFIQSGMVIQIYLDGTTLKSRILNIANQFIIWDGNTANLPFVFENGFLKLANVRLGRLYFDELLSNNEKLFLRGYGNLADFGIRF
ncbi:phage tail protein [Brucella anthropi]|uniref:phage tail tip fiber protein n=1 Tax=Brucella anthropi TaxID=529 RepID=UPI0026711933|nr:phage tail protein [Brucella anthropi]WKT93774.1 phage tail protein [Brucella anthropi]